MKTLNNKQKEYIAKMFGEEMVGEIAMRTDDHSGFETERMFNGLKRLFVSKMRPAALGISKKCHSN